MTYKGLIKQSHTMDFMALTAVFGIVEMNLPLVREQLGNYYGWVFIGFAVAGALLRMKTTSKIGEK